MALDLTLIAIPSTAKGLFQKASDNIDYAREFDKIADLKRIELHLKMVQTNPDEQSESALNDLYQDSKNVIEHYPDHNADKYRFHSTGRGYDTLNYLLLKYFNQTSNHELRLIDSNNIFYSGTAVNSDITEHVRFQYWDNHRTSDFNNFIKNIEFYQLVKFYDHDEMSKVVYKLTTPDKFNYLKEEFEKLQQFYSLASSLDAFVIILVD